MTSGSLPPRWAPAIATAAGLLALATGCSSSSGSAASSPPSSSDTTPNVSMSGSTATVHLYSVQEASTLYTADGRPIAKPSTAPAPGSYVVGTDTDYDGNHTTHSGDAVGTDHLYCLITKPPATGTCSAEIALGTAMLLTDNSTQDLSGDGAMTFPITGGTGKYAGVHGTVTVTQVSGTNNSDITLTYSR